MIRDLPSELQEALAGVLSIERELGRGGMGTVFLARDVILDRPCALKVLHSALAEDPRERERFLIEARTAARLSHPHIVPIFDVGVSAGFVWFTMGLVDGESLAARLARVGPLPADEVTRLLREIGWALANAHARGVLHRDVTLDNILIDRRSGRAMLADFGIAARVGHDENIPLVGTAEYLAPELIQGYAPTPAADLYALGMVGWSCLTGFLPFTDSDPGKVLLRQIEAEVPSLARAALATPSRLRSAIEALLHKNPDRRPTSAENWLTMLDEPTTALRLADPLERWLDSRAVAAPYRALGLALAGMGTAVAVQVISENLALGVGLVSAGGLAISLIVGVAAQVGIGIRSLRQVARAGFGVEDLRLGLDQQRLARYRRGPESADRIGRAIRIMGNATGLSAVAVILMFEAASALPWSIRFMLWDAGKTVLVWGLILFWLSRSVNQILPGTPVATADWRTRLRNRFWASRWANGLFSAIGIGLPRGQPPEVTLHRPTELILDLQIEERWRALPEPQRQGLEELPSVARSLRNRVREIRQVQEVLERSGPAKSDETRGLAERLEQRRLAAMGALERLRVLVTRLAGSTELPGNLTMALRDARAVETEVLIELGAHHAVDRVIRGPNLAATPA